MLAQKFNFPDFKIKLFLVLTSSLILGGCLPQINRNGTSTTDEFLHGGIVKNFPSLPLYKGAQPVESYGHQNSYGASFITGDDLQKVLKFYDQSLRVTGWDTQLFQKSANNYLFQIKNQQYQGEVIINTTADGKKTAISLFLWPR